MKADNIVSLKHIDNRVATCYTNPRTLHFAAECVCVYVCVCVCCVCVCVLCVCVCVVCVSINGFLLSENNDSCFPKTVKEY
jgi:hypothetical protein